jgi:DNA-3-methyladenine glycosylase I
MAGELKRCWNAGDPIPLKYHDEEWGSPLHDDNKLFEFLVLDSFQAGLSWDLILKRRDALRGAFCNFDPEKVAQFGTSDLDRILNTPGVIRNRAKILAAVENARRFLEIQREFGSFDAFIWRFVSGKTISNGFTRWSQVPAQTEESRAMSDELKRRGFRFVGPTICYAFMQASGLVNDHLTHCFRYEEIRRIASNT